MSIDFHEFADTASLDAALADFVVARLADGIAQRGRASLVVSGGRTPRGLFTRLSRADLDWSSIDVTLADERWVPNDHADSNERSVREALLVDRAATARFLAPFDGSATAEAGCAAWRAGLAKFTRPFDVLILGMGNDGHTASLFPDAAEIGTGLDLGNDDDCLAVHPTLAPHARISLTRKRILDSRCLVLHVTGADKRELLERVMAEGPVEQYPIRLAFQQTDVPFHVFRT
ncbi:6-phosphogluconolactonase [Derxia gummosa]|uniref:6-phosphogluconolactonase n=1 Tax=Derxia gummosa DSM 723 TaxID=1121388 RepID=A0A8B6X6D3_9BURK|nr:6-phosphogluconolactonase [Derxia gummosa]